MSGRTNFQQFMAPSYVSDLPLWAEWGNYQSATNISRFRTKINQTSPLNLFFHFSLLKFLEKLDSQVS